MSELTDDMLNNAIVARSINHSNLARSIELNRAKVQKLEKLKEYATHKGFCDIVFNDDVTLDCSCGYDDLKEHKP